MKLMWFSSCFFFENLVSSESLIVTVAGRRSWGPSSPCRVIKITPSGLTQHVVLRRSAKYVPASWEEWAIRVSCVGVVTLPGLCPIAQETDSAALTLDRV